MTANTISPPVLRDVHPAMLEDTDGWIKSGGLFLSPTSCREVTKMCSRLPAASQYVNVRVPVVGYRGAHRPNIGGDRTISDQVPFLLRCQVFGNGILGIELKQPTPALVKPLGRPIFGYCSRDVVSSYFGDEFSTDLDIDTISTHIDPNGATLVSTETDEGAIKILNGVETVEVGVLATVCLGVYIDKCKVLSQANSVVTPKG